MPRTSGPNYSKEEMAEIRRQYEAEKKAKEDKEAEERRIAAIHAENHRMLKLQHYSNRRG